MFPVPFDRFLLGNDAGQDYPLGQRRALAVGALHVGLAALGHGAEVHVHEGLAAARPEGDLHHLGLVGVRAAAHLDAREHHLVVHQEVEVICASGRNVMATAYAYVLLRSGKNGAVFR